VTDSTNRAEGDQRFATRSFAAWRRDAVVCLSLANLFFLPGWDELFSYRSIVDILLVRKTIPEPVDDLAVMTVVVLLAALLFGAVSLAKRYLKDSGFLAVPAAAVVLGAIPVIGLRWRLEGTILDLNSPLIARIGYRAVMLLMVMGLTPLLWPAWKYRRFLSRVAGAILVVVSPFCVLTFGQAMWEMARYKGQPYRDGPLAPRLATTPTSQRLVWIIYDEWDYRLTFVDRPAGLAMPAIDRLRGESLLATGAESPGPNTRESLPGLITGRRMTALIDPSAQTIFLEPSGKVDAKPVRWGDDNSIFTAVRKSGFNVGLVGWYLPYCRFMNGPLSECAWWAAPFRHNAVGCHYLAGLLGTGFWGRVGDYVVSLFETYNCFWFWKQTSAARYKGRMLREYMTEAKRQVADPGLGLVFLHVPVPHGPHPYNRLTGRMDSTKDLLAIGYVDSLALMDQMMGELRAAMEANRTWDRTVLLISADHPFRVSRALDGKFDPRVPFMLRFPGRPTAGVYTPEFNTIITANLIYAIINGSVSTVSGASNWLDRHRRERESPVAARN
jgi:hypothetical protein